MQDYKNKNIYCIEGIERCEMLRVFSLMWNNRNRYVLQCVYLYLKQPVHFALRLFLVDVKQSVHFPLRLFIFDVKQAVDSVLRYFFHINILVFSDFKLQKVILNCIKNKSWHVHTQIVDVFIGAMCLWISPLWRCMLVLTSSWNRKLLKIFLTKLKITILNIA